MRTSCNILLSHVICLLIFITNGLNLTDETQIVLQYLSFPDQCTIRALNSKHKSKFDHDQTRCEIMKLVSYFQNIKRDETSANVSMHQIKIIYNKIRFCQSFFKIFPLLMQSSWTVKDPNISHRLTHALRAMTGWNSNPNKTSNRNHSISLIQDQLIRVSAIIPLYGLPKDNKVFEGRYPNQILKFLYHFCYKQLASHDLLPSFQDIYNG
eukprot:983808_1